MLHRSMFTKRVVNCDTIFRCILVPEIQPHGNNNDSISSLPGLFRVRRGVVGRLGFRVGVSVSYSFFPD